MKKSLKSSLLTAAVAGLVGAAMSAAPSRAEEKKKNDKSMTMNSKMERCYGINKCKGTADCHGKGRSCKGTNNCDSAMVPDAFILLPKGACERIKGGSLTPPTEKKG